MWIYLELIHLENISKYLITVNLHAVGNLISCFAGSKQ